MSRINLKQLGATRAATVAALVATLGISGIAASADDLPGAAPSFEAVAFDDTVANLEKSFWRCDYVATVAGVDSGTGITCSSITQALQEKKFNGDFDAMLTWWQENKAAEHQTIYAETVRTRPHQSGAH